MKVKTIIDENFQDYYKTSMLIGCSYCDWKCELEDTTGTCKCHNSDFAKSEIIDFKDEFIVNRYINNNLTDAIIIAGLEPFMQFEELFNLIIEFRKKTDDDIVIYTGYYPEEIENQIDNLTKFKNIIVKFGRYVPNTPSRYDEILRVELISENQYAKKIS